MSPPANMVVTVAVIALSQIIRVLTIVPVLLLTPAKIFCAKVAKYIFSTDQAI